MADTLNVYLHHVDDAIRDVPGDSAWVAIRDYYTNVLARDANKDNYLYGTTYPLQKLPDTVEGGDDGRDHWGELVPRILLGWLGADKTFKFRWFICCMCELIFLLPSIVMVVSGMVVREDFPTWATYNLPQTSIKASGGILATSQFCLLFYLIWSFFQYYKKEFTIKYDHCLWLPRIAFILFNIILSITYQSVNPRLGETSRVYVAVGAYSPLLIILYFSQTISPTWRKSRRIVWLHHLAKKEFESKVLPHRAKREPQWAYELLRQAQIAGMTNAERDTLIYEARCADHPTEYEKAVENEAARVAAGPVAVGGVAPGPVVANVRREFRRLYDALPTHGPGIPQQGHLETSLNNDIASYTGAPWAAKVTDNGNKVGYETGETNAWTAINNWFRTQTVGAFTPLAGGALVARGRVEYYQNELAYWSDHGRHDIGFFRDLCGDGLDLDEHDVPKRPFSAAGTPYPTQIWPG